MATAEPIRRPVGQLQRGWREQRRLSQLDLAPQSDFPADTATAAPLRDG